MGRFSTNRNGKNHASLHLGCEIIGADVPSGIRGGFAILVALQGFDIGPAAVPGISDRQIDLEVDKLQPWCYMYLATARISKSFLSNS